MAGPDFANGNNNNNSSSNLNPSETRGKSITCKGILRITHKVLKFI